MFGSHSHCGCGDMAYLICHMTLQDHTIKGTCDFMGRLLIECSNSVIFNGHKHFEMFLTSHIASHDCEFKRLRNGVGGNFS